jgi:hypothetical protein
MLGHGHQDIIVSTRIAKHLFAVPANEFKIICMEWSNVHDIPRSQDQGGCRNWGKIESGCFAKGAATPRSRLSVSIPECELEFGSQWMFARTLPARSTSTPLLSEAPSR